MFVGSSVSRKEFDEVFLNCHICSLDRQCHGNNVSPYMVVDQLMVRECCHVPALITECEWIARGTEKHF